jgi:peptidoglycan/xylan/chitin deacetylase (PgdA/CDA1 family)
VLGDAVVDPVSRLFLAIRPQALSRAALVQRLEWLRAQWDFVPLDAVFTANVSPGRYAAALTFDDAYRDFLDIVAPLAKTLGLPVTFYVTVAPLDHEELLWFDQIYCSVAATNAPQVSLESCVSPPYKLRSAEERVAAAVGLCDLVSRLSPNARKKAVVELVDKLGPGPVRAKDLYLSRSDVAQLARQDTITIASHSFTHSNLLSLTDEELVCELAHSKSELEAISGKPVRHFSYPNGLCDERISRLAGECGYKTACATRFGISRDQLRLPRINLGWWEDKEFFVRTSARFRPHRTFGLSSLWAGTGE